MTVTSLDWALQASQLGGALIRYDARGVQGAPLRGKPGRRLGAFGEDAMRAAR